VGKKEQFAKHSSYKTLLDSQLEEAGPWEEWEDLGLR